MTSRPLWHEAASLAARRHAGQLRRDGRTPYVAHCFRVAMIVRDTFGCEDPVVLAAALLHDTIEDTPADYDEVAEAVGGEAAAVVAVLTKDMRLPEAAREAAYYAAIEAGPWQAKIIKLADGVDNVRDAGGLDADRRARALERLRHAIEIARRAPESQGGGPLATAVRMAEGVAAAAAAAAAAV